jgi:hypothetical protein
MKKLLACSVLALVAAGWSAPQGGNPGGTLPGANSGGTPRPPGAGRRQSQGPEPIDIPPKVMQDRELQWLHEQNLEDTSRLVKLSQELKWDLANHDREVLSVATVKKMEEIERLIKKIHARVRKL